MEALVAVMWQDRLRVATAAVPTTRVLKKAQHLLRRCRSNRRRTIAGAHRQFCPFAPSDETVGTMQVVGMKLSVPD